MAKIGSAVFQTSWHKPKASSQASRPSPKGPPIKRQLNPVSYTHLDVYKRQRMISASGVATRERSVSVP